jgi:hypothetical protein
MPAAASGEPDTGCSEENNRWAGVHDEHTDQGRPAPVRSVAVRIAHVDHERLSDPSQHQEEARR